MSPAGVLAVMAVELGARAGNLVLSAGIRVSSAGEGGTRAGVLVSPAVKGVLPAARWSPAFSRAWITAEGARGAVIPELSRAPFSD